MSGRHAEIEARIGAVHKLESVIAAMRGIAASRVQEAERHLGSIRSYAATIGQAIGTALAVLPPGREDAAVARRGPERRAVIVFAAEQGFAGAFTERVFDAAAPHLEGGAALFLAGDRGLAAAGRRGLEVAWHAPMIAHPAQAPLLAGRLAEAAFPPESAPDRVVLVHAVPEPGGVPRAVAKQLAPFDYARFPLRRAAVPPRITLPPRLLLERLAEEHVFAELAEAVMLSFAAENGARMRAMVAARDNTAETLEELTGLARRLRQEEITEEIVELATASLSGR
ncbi:F0F1 ATP synthase subunit gamma [Mangrovicoccus sp. HB161399]|uniref:F0F1 ATP synthase subunit gamma n=1 Tax=Mangrovicoccus sp. HB161399 TaxID=2720392 RepID=UPI001556B7C5|nr:FoF1 ATP synthase subunit gamma [Mangrovicoccus sp. HB161399]